jgi:hypothetical protein
MAKKSTTKSGGAGTGANDRRSGSANKRSKVSPSRAISKRETSSGERTGGKEEFRASDAFYKLLESPIVVELIAVAATAALAAIAESRFTTRSGGGPRRTVKAAGKAAAAAVGRRLNTEMEEIMKAAQAARSGEKA